MTRAPFRTLLTLALFAPALQVMAEGERPGGYLSEEQVAEYMKLQNQYRLCLLQRSGETAGEYEDVRQVIDVAMGRCKGELEQLRTAMKGHQVPPGFIEAFLHNTVRRAVKQAMPRVMMMQAEQQP